MIKISRISSPLKDKIKNIETCSQLDGDGVFEGKYSNRSLLLPEGKKTARILSLSRLRVFSNGETGVLDSEFVAVSADEICLLSFFFFFEEDLFVLPEENAVLSTSYFFSINSR